MSGGTARLMSGSHTFTVVIPDYPKQTLTRNITPETKVISLTLDVGHLTVMVDRSAAPPGGIAYLDGDELGPVPLVRRLVPAGEHELAVRWPGEDGVFRTRITVPRLPGPPLVIPPVAPPRE